MIFNLFKKDLIKLGYLSCLGIGFLASSSYAEMNSGTTNLSGEIVHIEQGWVREMPPTVMLTAAYMQITNLTDNTLILIGGSSPDFATVEIHQTVFEGGMAKMVPQEQLPIPSHQTVELKPKGLHIMLIDRQRPLKAGDHVNLTLNFKENMAQTITLEVKTPDNTEMSGNMHHHAH